MSAPKSWEFLRFHAEIKLINTTPHGLPDCHRSLVPEIYKEVLGYQLNAESELQEFPPIKTKKFDLN